MKMTTKQLEAVFYGKPFQPFSVQLKNGEEVIVQKPHKVSISADRLAVVGITRFPSGKQRQGLRFIPVEEVISASPIG